MESSLRLKLPTSSIQKQYKLGDVREDGKVFFCDSKKRGEVWISQEQYVRARFNVALQSAKARSKKKRLPFNIDTDYLIEIFPKDGKCPVFGIDMEFGGNQNTSPSLDRIHPALGYVKGNVMWISGYANTLKSLNTLDTLRTLLAFYEKLERRNE